MEANIDTRFHEVANNEIALACILCLVHFHSSSYISDG